MIESEADITVVICTRNRADSLRETVAALARADRNGLHCELVIVDNGGTDATPEVARTTIPGLPVHYLRESRPGKYHAANRALVEAPLGQLVAFLDDDMCPDVDWFKGVKAIADRWPDVDLFTGQSHIIWPKVTVPAWCRHPQLRGWAFSVMGASKETPLEPGQWFSGNHFWFRSRVLKEVRRFGSSYAPDDIQIYTAEPQFMLQLIEDGHRGLRAPDAVCGHRVQPELLQFEYLRQRARRVGRGFAVARLQPYKPAVKQCQLFRRHPLLGRVFCVASILGWIVAELAARLDPRATTRIPRLLYAIQRQATYREYLRLAAGMPEYRVFGRQKNG